MLLGESRNQSAANHKFHAEQEKYWHDSSGSISAKLQNFTKYVRREDLTKFTARNDVFVRQLHVHGSVIDVGVGRGASLMTWLAYFCLMTGSPRTGDSRSMPLFLAGDR